MNEIQAQDIAALLIHI